MNRRGMSEGENEEYWEKIDVTFFNQGYGLAQSLLPGELSKKALFEALRIFYKKIDEFLGAFLDRAEMEGQACECKKGCSFCCHQTVLAGPLEFFYLSDFVNKKFRDNALSTILERARAKHEKTKELKLDKLLKFKAPCPFLHPQGGFCRIYQARPLACRIYLSLSRKSCEDDLATPYDDRVYPQLFELPLRAGKMMNEGFLACLSDKSNKKIKNIESSIETGFLDANKSDAFEDWLKGKSRMRTYKG